MCFSSHLQSQHATAGGLPWVQSRSGETLSHPIFTPQHLPPRTLKTAVRGWPASQCCLGAPLSGFNNVSSLMLRPNRQTSAFFSQQVDGSTLPWDALQGEVGSGRLCQWAVVYVGRGAGTNLPLPQPPPALSVKCQQAREGGRRDRQAVNPQDAGAWVVQAQAPRQLFWHVL